MPGTFLENFMRNCEEGDWVDQGAICLGKEKSEEVTESLMEPGGATS